MVGGEWWINQVRLKSDLDTMLLHYYSIWIVRYMTNIILCGGSGTRLWPISRTLMPKQFIKLFEDKSLFQLTLERNLKFCQKSYIVANSEHYFLAYDQIEELNSPYRSEFLLEPFGRNTAPAIALACISMPYDEIVLVTPSDHLIKDEEEYSKVVERAKELASKDNLVTFGITPTFPETGFGYIEAQGYDVKAFHEKPDLKTATEYVEALNYYWNSGMFCFKAGVFLEELKKYAPSIYEKSQEAYANAIKKETTRIKPEDMSKIPNDSIDYAVMERSKITKVVPSSIGWSDLGSFDALYEELPKDKDANTINKNHINIDSKNNLILADERVIATIDVEDLIIVDTADALLIGKKGSSQKVKFVVDSLKQRDTQLHNIHLTAHRPWGTYTVLEDNEGYKIKRLVVKPNKRLSLQKHFHRNEHWVVVSGEAKVTINDKKIILKQNESTYINAGDAHRLENASNIDLVVIEAQVGSYLGEDDIVRLEDDFKRD